MGQRVRVVPNTGCMLLGGADRELGRGWPFCAVQVLKVEHRPPFSRCVLVSKGEARQLQHPADVCCYHRGCTLSAVGV